MSFTNTRWGRDEVSGRHVYLADGSYVKTRKRRDVSREPAFPTTVNTAKPSRSRKAAEGLPDLSPTTSTRYVVRRHSAVESPVFSLNHLRPDHGLTHKCRQTKSKAETRPHRLSDPNIHPLQASPNPHASPSTGNSGSMFSTSPGSASQSSSYNTAVRTPSAGRGASKSKSKPTRRPTPIPSRSIRRESASETPMAFDSDKIPVYPALGEALARAAVPNPRRIPTPKRKPGMNALRTFAERSGVSDVNAFLESQQVPLSPPMSPESQPRRSTSSAGAPVSPITPIAIPPRKSSRRIDMQQQQQRRRRSGSIPLSPPRSPPYPRASGSPPRARRSIPRASGPRRTSAFLESPISPVSRRTSDASAASELTAAPLSPPLSPKSRSRRMSPTRRSPRHAGQTFLYSPSQPSPAKSTWQPPTSWDIPTSGRGSTAATPKPSAPPRFEHFNGRKRSRISSSSSSASSGSRRRTGGGRKKHAKKSFAEMLFGRWSPRNRSERKQRRQDDDRGVGVSFPGTDWERAERERWSSGDSPKRTGVKLDEEKQRKRGKGKKTTEDGPRATRKDARHGKSRVRQEQAVPVGAAFGGSVREADQEFERDRRRRRGKEREAGRKPVYYYW